MLLERNVEDTGTTLFFLYLPDGLFLLYSFSQVDSNGQPLDIVSLFGLGYIHTINVVLFTLDDFAFRLRKLDVENKLTGQLFCCVDVRVLQSAHLDEF